MTNKLRSVQFVTGHLTTVHLSWHYLCKQMATRADTVSTDDVTGAFMYSCSTAVIL